MSKKKLLIIKGIACMLPIMLPFVIFMIITMSIATNAEPVSPPATENKASEYQAECSALGVPWDVILLVDTQRAQNEIDDYNPLETALLFTELIEKEYAVSEEETENENGEKTVIQHKRLEAERRYQGLKNILSYVGVNEIGKLNVASLFSRATSVASKKSSDKTSYEVEFKATEQIEQILERIGFDEEEIKNIMDLHTSRYLILLYNGSETAIGNIKIDVGTFKENEEAVWYFLKTIGFNDVGAAAAMGNAKVESEFNPAANHNNHYFGLFQWGLGRWKGNKICLSDFALQSGTEWSDLEMQLNFFNVECSKSYKSVYEQMKIATDIVYATDYFCVWYEGCSGQLGNWAYSVINNKPYQGLADRRAYAQAYYQKYAGKAVEE